MVGADRFAGVHVMNQRFRPLSCLFTFVMLNALSNDAVALVRHGQTQLRPKKADVATGAGHKRNSALKKGEHTAHVAAARLKPAPFVERPAPNPGASPLSGDLAAVKEAIDLVRETKTGDATVIKNAIGDPVARKLVEWLILRHSDSKANFDRYAAFIADNPNWPSVRLLRRRAEGRLWQERSDAATVRRFTGGQPASATGRFALARALLAEQFQGAEGVGFLEFIAQRPGQIGHCVPTRDAMHVKPGQELVDAVGRLFPRFELGFQFFAHQRLDVRL